MPFFMLFSKPAYLLLQVHLCDTVQARRLLPDADYEPLSPPSGDEALSSQAWLLQHWKSRNTAPPEHTS
jgi:hypothetical protein